MLVLITYDVNTQTAEGRKRLRMVAKICINYGQRVQNSVFEMDISPDRYIYLKNELLKIIDNELDSIRFYNIGKNYKPRIEMIGKNDTYDAQTDTFIF